jgi:tetratricopeptide (TPR) repeat protein
MTGRGVGPYCPQCSQPATGNFCQQCGAKLGGRFCNECGSKVAPGAKFCNQCGNEVSGKAGAPGGARKAAAAAAFGGQNLAWWIAGGAMFVLIMFIGVSMVRPAGPTAPTAPGATPAAPAAGGGVPPDISQMTPIDAADRLFERVMQAVSAGDSAQAQGFLPMALGAYERARPLDLDGLFHLSLLNRTAKNLEAALDNARQILEENPDHLLGLAAAAEAAIELGLADEAEAHYRHLQEVYDSEIARELEEYIAHARIVEVLEQDAERFLAGR